jgi:hypothetical protein
LGSFFDGLFPSEVGRRRGARNTGPFPSAPSRTRRMSFPITGSPVITFRVIGSQMTLRTVSVSRITQPSPPDYRDHLCPFALIPAFPDFMAGRDSGDYHGHSSPWGSRPVGDPAVRLRCTSRARRRPPTHPLDPPRWRALRATEVARSHGSCPSMARHRLQASFRRMRTFIVGDWALGNPALALSCGSCGTPPWTPPDGHRVPDMLWSPSGFPHWVSQAIQEPPSEFLPAAPGIQRSASRSTPCMRFSRTRLTDAVHRRHSVFPARAWYLPWV